VILKIQPGASVPLKRGTSSLRKHFCGGSSHDGHEIEAMLLCEAELVSTKVSSLAAREATWAMRSSICSELVLDMVEKWGKMIVG